jgi:branched-chain amino acid transport system substrate-binding protein
MNEQKKWVFKTTQNDDIIAKALTEHMVKAGVRTLGLIGTADPYGENWEKVMGGLAEANGIKIIASEKFQRSDSSVTGQALKILGAKPDAVLVTAPGGPSVLPQTTLFDMGYKGQIYQTHGAALSDYIAAYEKMHGNKPATFGANVYDAGLLLKQAIPLAALKGKPGTPEFRSALRDALEETKELVGTQGVYNMSPADHSGFDDRGRVMITVKEGNWTLLK